MKKIVTSLALAFVLVGQLFAAPLPQDAGDKMKSGIKSIGKGAKDLGKGTAQGTKNVAKATVKGVKRAGKATKKGIKKAGKATKRTVKKGVNKVGVGTEKAGAKMKAVGK